MYMMLCKNWRIWKSFGSVLHETADGGTSIISAIGGARHDTLNGAIDLDEELLGSLRRRTCSKFSNSTRGAITGIGIYFMVC